MLPSITTADNHHVPSAKQQAVGRLAFRGQRTCKARFLQPDPEEYPWSDPNNAGKFLSFPAPAPFPGSPAQNWSVRILETKDKLVSALDYLRIAYNEMLVGRPVKAADEILAQVEAILRSDKKLAPFTVVSGSGSMSQFRHSQSERSCCSFPQ